MGHIAHLSHLGLYKHFSNRYAFYSIFPTRRAGGMILYHVRKISHKFKFFWPCGSWEETLQSLWRHREYIHNISVKSA